MVDNREDIVGRTWLIRKDGYFYRPDKSGYTTSKAEAGRYNEADAKLECEIEPWHMKAIHENEWPDDPVSEDINDQIARLTSENATLRARLETVEAETIDLCAKEVESFGTIRQTMTELEYQVNDVYGGDATVDEFVPIIARLQARAIRNLEPRLEPRHD